MQNTPITSPPKIPKFICIASGGQVKKAWSWLVNSVNTRPNHQPGNCCVYDQKRWQSIPALILDANHAECVETLAILFITSQLAGDVGGLLPLADGNDIDDIGISTTKLEVTIKNLISDEKRFRHALSEHLAFWLQFATIAQNTNHHTFALTPPNYLPEDTGPDGLLLAFDKNSVANVELRSVKSSIHDPSSLIASAEFRNGGNASPDKQLEEFYLTEHEGRGFGRLHRLLSNVYNSLRMQSTQAIRSTLLHTHKSYNAVVVADQRHERYEIFSSFGRVSANPTVCIATYIGSVNWALFAEAVRMFVWNTFDGAGVL